MSLKTLWLAVFWWAVCAVCACTVPAADIGLVCAAFQNVRTVDEVEMARREEMKQLASSLVWDMRNAAAQDGQLDSALAQRLDALEEKLIADHCHQEPGFYNDNARYKGEFQLLLKEATAAGEQVRDSASFLSRTLVQQQGPLSATDCRAAEDEDFESMPGLTSCLSSLCGCWGFNGSRTLTQQQRPSSARVWPSSAASDSNHTSVPAVNVPAIHVPGSNEVSELHSKFTQDPNFKGIRGRFGADKLFAAGIDAIVGPMVVQVYMHVCINTHTHTHTHEHEHALIFENKPRPL